MSSLTQYVRKLFPRRQSPLDGTQLIEPSKDMARRRLQLVLVQDRIGLSSELLEDLKRDLLTTISKYVVIQRETVDMQITRNGDSVVLVSNIRVTDVRKAGV